MHFYNTDTDELLKSIQAQESKKLCEKEKELRNTNKSCKLCSSFSHKKFLTICRKQKDKQVKPYNICHLFKDKE